MLHTCRFPKKKDQMFSYYLVISNVSAPAVMSGTVIPFTGGFSSTLYFRVLQQVIRHCVFVFLSFFWT